MTTALETGRSDEYNDWPLKGQFKMSASNLPTDKGKVKHT